MQHRYRAADPTGKILRGVMVAANPIDLEQRLARLGLTLIDSRELAKKPPRFNFLRPVSRREMLNFCLYLEQLLGSGVPLLEGLADLRDGVENPRFRRVLAMLIQDIEGGKAVSDAMSEHPDVFDTVFINLVRAGETTGTLPTVLAKMADSLKWQDELAAQTKKLLMYPAFVGTVITGVIFFLMIYLVPQLVSFIEGISPELPWQTRALLWLSNFFVNWWWALLAAPFCLWGALVAAQKGNPDLAFQLDRLKLGVPKLGQIYQKIVLARFTSTFSMMFAAGITVLEAIRICEGVVGSKVIAAALADIRRMISEGRPITDSFAATKLFPALVIRMLKVGEQTGAIDRSLQNVSYFYDRDVKDAIDKMQAMIEPSLTVILGVILAMIMSAVLGPIYDMVTKMAM